MSSEEHDNIADQKCFLRTVAAFESYQTVASRVCEKRRSDWQTRLPPGHSALLELALKMTKTQGEQQLLQQQQQQTQNHHNKDNNKKNDDDAASPSDKNNNSKAATSDDAVSSFQPTKNWNPQHFDTQLFCIRENQAFLNDVAECAREDLFDDYFPPKRRVGGGGGRNNNRQPQQNPRPKNFGSPSAMDQDKVFSTLRQIVRDWSKEGAYERKEVYDYFYDSLAQAHPDPKKRNDVKVLVPGGGLSRLMVEIAARGYSALGNEFSYHMLMTGHYIMNRCTQQEEYTIFPYCDLAINNWSRDNQFQAISFPDESASEMFADSEKVHGTNGHGDLGMIAGDFVEVFSKKQEIGAWNAVASCFFLDTAHNICQYLQVIHQCLVPGGLLINVGPLLFHWADSFEDVSIEITYEELKNLLHLMGFEIIHEKVVKTAYTTNPNAMKQNFYQCPAFVARKVEPKFPISDPIDPDAYHRLPGSNNNNNHGHNHNNSSRRNNNNNNSNSNADSASKAVSVESSNINNASQPASATSSPAPTNNAPPSYNENVSAATSSTEAQQNPRGGGRNSGSRGRNNNNRNSNKNRSRGNGGESQQNVQQN